MSKLEYIKSVLMTLDKNLLESPFTLDDGSEVKFIEYCIKYLPDKMDDNFKLVDNDFLENLEDLVNYQKYKFEKRNNNKIVITEEESKNVSNHESENLENINLEDVKVILKPKKIEENKTVEEEKVEDVSIKVDIEPKIEDTSLIVETKEEKEKKEKIQQQHYQRTQKIKAYYKDALNLIPFFLKTSDTLDDYINLLYPYVDEDYNVIENGYKVPFEEEIREKASLAINSYNYATNLLNAIKEKGINHVDITYIQGYIKSVNENFNIGNVYYDLALLTVKESFNILKTPAEKDKLFKEIMSTPDIMNLELFEDIKEYYQYSKRSDMKELMTELDGENKKESKGEDKIDELPRYILDAIDKITESSNNYQKLEIKDSNTLGKILNSLTCAMLDIENRIKDTNDQDLIIEYKKANKLRNLIKLDKDFHDSMYHIRNSYKNYKGQLEREDGEANQYFIESFRKLEKQVNYLFNKIGNNRSLILTSEDMLLYENISGTISYLLNDLQEQKKQR